MAKRLSRKELHLKEDPFVEFLQDAQDYAKAHYEKIIATVVVTLVVVVGGYAWSSMRAKNAEEATTQFTTGMELFQKGMAPAAGQNAQEPTPAPKDRADSLKQASDAFQVVIEQHGDSRYAEAALYYQAMAAFYRGEKSESLRLHQQYLHSYPTGFFAGGSWLTQALINEQDNKRGPAIDLIDEYLRLAPEDSVALEMLMTKARLARAEGESLQQAGQEDQAKPWFQKALDVYQSVAETAGDDNPYTDAAKKETGGLRKLLGLPPEEDAKA